MREQPGQIIQEESLPRFGNYDLVHRIDVGGMGEVYLAHQRSAFAPAQRPRVGCDDRFPGRVTAAV